MPASVRDVLLLIRTKEDAQRALAGISREMSRASATAAAATARAQAAATRAHASQLRATGATRAQVDAVNATARAYDNQARQIEASRARHEVMRRAVLDAGEAFTAIGVAALAAGAATAYGLKQAIDTAVEYDRQVRLTYTQVDKRFKPSLQELGDIGRRAARDIAVPFEEIQPALFEVFSSTEANVKQAEGLLREFAKAAVAGQTDVQTASRATIGIMNAFRLPFEKANRVLDIQFQLVQEGVGTYEEWAQRIGLVTPSAVRAGQTVESMAAALATATRLGISAARAGTAVARAFDAISNPKTIANLKEMNVQVLDAKGNFRPMVDIMEDWQKALMKLPPAKRVASILDTLKGAGSTIEARRFLQGILLTQGGMELYQEVMKEFSTDVGAFDKAYSTMADSTASKTTILNNKWQLVKETIGRELMPTWNKMLDGFGKALDWFNELPGGVQKNIATFLLIGSVVGIFGGALLVVIGTLAIFGSAIAGAILPITIAAGVVAALIVQLGLIGAALILAYKNSTQFRGMLAELGVQAKRFWDIIVATAAGIYTAFTQNILPPLKELWNVLQNEVFPVVAATAKQFGEVFLPKLEETGRIVRDVLASAFSTIGALIRDHLIPAIQDLSTWWNEHRNQVMPVIEVLAQLFKWAMIIVAVLGAAGLVTAVVFVIGAFKMFVAQVKLAWTIIQFGIGIIKGIIGIIGSLIGWLRNAAQKWAEFKQKAMEAINNVVKTIKGAFSSAGTMLLQVGKDLIQGLINGIGSKIGGLKDAARNAAKAAYEAATGFFRTGSPSKLFKDLGQDVIRGLILGITGSRKQLADALYRIQRDVMRSINAADIKASAKAKMRSRWTKRLQKDTAKLMSLEAKRAALQGRLAAAQKSLDDQMKARADLAEKVFDALAKSADLTTLSDKQQKSAQGMIQGLKVRLDAMKKFTEQLRDLAKRGFDKDTIAQLAQQGVEGAGAMVNTLANSTDAELQQISQLQKEIRGMAQATGTNVAGDLYNAGIAAAQGLIKGLQSQIGAITKEMEKIAKALVAAIKKELGIRSPSTVFAGIGVDTVRGYAQGFTKHMKLVTPQLQQAMHMNTPRQALPVSTPFGAPVGSLRRPYGALMPPNETRNDVTVNVYTNELDPRKTAAQLGWELEGRLG